MTRAAVATLATAATLMLPTAAGALALSVSTGSPQDVAATTATLRATVAVSALATNVTWQYGTTTAYGLATTAVSPSVLAVTQDVTLPIAGLSPDTTYHVRAVASGALGTTYGKDVKFGTAKVKSGNGSSGSGDDDSGSGSSGSGSSGSGSSGSGSSSSGTPSTTTPTTTSPTKSDDKTKTPATSDDTSSDDGSSALADDDGTDGGATVAPGVATADVTPVLGRTLAVATVAGKVTATAPTGATVDLAAAKAVPTGTLIDTRGGTVELTSALDRKGTTQTARFWGGLFEVRQTTTTRGLTQLVLRGSSFGACGKAVASRKTKKKKAKPARGLWGSDDHGRFETRGRGSVATVRGTRWFTQDTCAGTRTTVAAGAVAVKDLARGKTVVVTKGHNYLARVAP